MTWSNSYHEGELREIVELTVPPALLDSLILQQKVKQVCSMVYMPEHKIGKSKSNESKSEGGKKKAIEESEWDGLAEGIDALIGMPTLLDSVSTVAAVQPRLAIQSHTMYGSSASVATSPKAVI